MSEFDLLSFRRFQTIIMILNKIKLLFILQLEKLLEEVRKVTLNEKGEFSSKSALFVCNKWDLYMGVICYFDLKHKTLSSMLQNSHDRKIQETEC